MSASSPTPELSASRSSSPSSGDSRLSSPCDDEMSQSKGISKDTTLGKRRRSPSWDLSQRFDEEEDGGYLDEVTRSWKEAQESCEFMLRWSATGSPGEERAYIRFLEEREAIAREMLAKVVCLYAHICTDEASEVMETYVAENMGAGAGSGDTDITGERPPKKPRKDKVAVIARLSEELREQLDEVNMKGYEMVDDRFRCVYSHVGSAHGKLTARDLGNTLRGYCYKPKHKSLLEEEALARLIIGYSDINMEQLSEAFVDVKTAYSCGPKDARVQMELISGMESQKERIHEAEKFFIVWGMKKESAGFLEGIFLIMAELRVAIDRKNMPDTDEGRKWKRKQQEEMFNIRWGNVVANLSVLERNAKERQMKNKWRKAYEKVVTRQNKVLALFKMFGCIVLLDPIWSPMETSSPDFHRLHACLLDNALTRGRRDGDDVEGNEVPWHTGNDMNNRKMLVESVRYFTTDEIAHFVEETVEQLEKDAELVVV
ncbi:hypothetical protein EYR36_010694 [Pleurotus pulmonarius]|nr:hypothetical protein EYR36_010694 [Pleurotus pulmonarius]